MDFATFGFGLGGDGRVMFVQPGLDRLRPLFVSFLDRLLRCEPPALEVFADRPFRQRQATFLFDQLRHRRTAPQVEVQFQLLGAFVDDGALDQALLLVAEQSALSTLPATPCRTDRRPATLPEKVYRVAHRLIA